MASPERPQGVENNSIWKSRLIRAGVFFTVVGVAVGWADVAAVGVVLFGAGVGWRLLRRRSKNE